MSITTFIYLIIIYSEIWDFEFILQDTYINHEDVLTKHTTWPYWGGNSHFLATGDPSARWDFDSAWEQYYTWVWKTPKMPLAKRRPTS